MLRRLLGVIALAVLAGASNAQPIQQSEFVEDTSFLRTIVHGRVVRLESYIVRRADLTGKLPVALIAHGKPATQGRMLDEHASEYVLQARDLARRGYLTVVTMRRGFGASDGPMAVSVNCATTSLLDRFNADADDLQSTLDAVGSRPDADGNRAIVIGVSAGGAAAAALSARNPVGLKAVINVSGGLRFESCPKEDALVAAFKDFGAASRVPQLWVYAKNDSLFGPALVEQMRGVSLDGGANVKLVMLEPDKFDGHAIFRASAARPKWLLEMDAFLRYLKLPTWTRQDVDALIKKLGMAERARGFVEGYVAGPSERTLAKQRDGTNYGYNFGNRSIDESRKRSVESCEKRASAACDVVMENDRWVGPAGAATGAPPTDKSR